MTANVKYSGYSNAGSLNFDVIIDIHCTSAVFDPFSVADMYHSALGTPATQTLPVIVQDSVSKVAGNQNGYDHCGLRVYSISTLPTTVYSNVLSLNSANNELTLGLVSTGLSDIKTYAIEITIKLQAYPTVTATATFTAHVTDCVVLSLAITPVADQAYNIYTPQISFAHTTFVQTPACMYTLDYTD